MSDPLWARNSSAESYGGHPQKRDYGMTGCVNALTDVSAEMVKRLAADMAAAARTVTLWSGTIARSGSTLTISYSRPLWTGASTVSYDGGSAPSGHPSAAITDTNEVTLTFPTTASDEYGSSADVAVSAAIPAAVGVSWDGTVGGNTVVLNGFTTGLTVSVLVW